MQPRAGAGGGGSRQQAGTLRQGSQRPRPDTARRPAARPAPARSWADPGRLRTTAKPAPTRPQPARPDPAAGPGRAGGATLPRMPFALLVLALLGGGLICLLVINTTLGAASFRVTQLQNAGNNLSQQEQTLQRQIASEQSPGQIERRAYQLGMRQPVQENFLDLATHRYYQPSGLPGGTGQNQAGTATPPPTARSRSGR